MSTHTDSDLLPLRDTFQNAADVLEDAALMLADDPTLGTVQNVAEGLAILAYGFRRGVASFDSLRWGLVDQ